MVRRLGPALLVLLLGACGPGGPEFVYVPAEGFEEALVARADLPEDGSVDAGQWVTLHANRVSGPWRRVARAEIGDAPCVRNVAPQSPEVGVESKVRWQVAPEQGVEWNSIGPPDYERRVRFSQPGRYTLNAVSNGCAEPFSSMPLEIVVR